MNDVPTGLTMLSELMGLDVVVDADVNDGDGCGVGANVPTIRDCDGAVVDVVAAVELMAPDVIVIVDCGVGAGVGAGVGVGVGVGVGAKVVGDPSVSIMAVAVAVAWNIEVVVFVAVVAVWLPIDGVGGLAVGGLTVS